MNEKKKSEMDPIKGADKWSVRELIDQLEDILRLSVEKSTTFQPWKINRSICENENEQFLLTQIQDVMTGLERNIQFSKHYPEKENLEYHNGQLHGLSNALGAIQAALRIYERKLNGTYEEGIK